MKRLLSFLAVAAIVPAAHATDFNMGAEYRLRFQHDGNAAGVKDGVTTNAFEHRVRLAPTFHAGERFTFHADLLHNNVWGVGHTNALPVQDEANMLYVYQAYGSWMVNDDFMLRFGQAAMTMGDGTVVAANDWERNPYAFTGVMGTYDMEFGRLSFFGVKFADPAADTTGAAPTVADPESNAFGLAYSVKALPEFLNMVNVHVIQVNTDRLDADANSTSEEQLRYGLTVAGETAGVDYRATYAAHTGELRDAAAAKTDREGSMYHIEVGYSLPDMMNTRFYVAYHSDSGQKDGTDKVQSYDSFFYDKHNNAGLMDVVNWGNLTYISAGVTLSPMEDLDLGLHYHMFSRTEKTDGVVAGNNGGILSNFDDDKDAIGSEINLVATQRYSDDFQIQAWVGQFMPGDYLKLSTGPDRESYTQFFVEAKMTF